MEGARTSVEPISPVFLCGLMQGKREMHSVHLSRTTIRFWSGFSGGQWLCCSPFTQTAHASRQNLLTLHRNYHACNVDMTEKFTR